MSKRFLIIIGITLLLASIGIVVIEAADRSQHCYEYCKKYTDIDLFAACYDGCMHN